MSSKQEELRRRLEQWKIEKGRKVKPDKPWLPVYRKPLPQSQTPLNGSHDGSVVSSTKKENNERVSDKKPEPLSIALKKSVGDNKNKTSGEMNKSMHSSTNLSERDHTEGELKENEKPRKVTLPFRRSTSVPAISSRKTLSGQQMSNNGIFSRANQRLHVGSNIECRNASLNTERRNTFLVSQSKVMLAKSCSVEDMSSCHAVTEENMVKKAAKPDKLKFPKSVTFDVPFRNDSPSPTLRNRLEHWLAVRGKTPSEYRHLHCFGVHLSQEKKHKVTANLRSPLSEIYLGASPDLKNNEMPDISFHDDALKDCGELKSDFTDEQEKLSEAISDLRELLKCSYPLQGISDWLDEIYVEEPTVERLSVYWMCRAELSQSSGNLFEAVNLLDRGIASNAQPTKSLGLLRSKFIRLMKSLNKEVNQENMFESTQIKYGLSESPPPYFRDVKLVEQSTMESVYITPVRRSSRLSKHITTPLSTPSRKHFVSYIDNVDKIPGEFKNRDVIRLANPAFTKQ